MLWIFIALWENNNHLQLLFGVNGVKLSCLKEQQDEELEMIQSNGLILLRYARGNLRGVYEWRWHVVELLLSSFVSFFHNSPCINSILKSETSFRLFLIIIKTNSNRFFLWTSNTNPCIHFAINLWSITVRWIWREAIKSHQDLFECEEISFHCKPLTSRKTN
jgi:hypothetical protein